MARAGAPHSPERIRAVVEAAAWRAQLTERGIESSAAFEAWLAADPEHETAWSETQATWDLVDDFATAPEMLQARREALGRVDRRNRSTGPRRRTMIGAVAAAALVIVAGSGAAAWYYTRPLDYRTGLGERRTIALSDGSIISLDARSEVKVRYSRRARRLELVSGQARFDVAHDAGRPFSVAARDRAVLATGTTFNVDIVDRSLAVLLIEGKVAVVEAERPNPLSSVRPPASASRRRVILTPGEQLLVSPSGNEVVTKGNVEQAMAWQAGQLVFDNEPIAAVAARVSRYAGRPIRVAADAADLRVSGVFMVGDTQTFLDAVTSFLPVTAAADDRGDTVLRRLR